MSHQIKLEWAKFANSVKCGTKEESFVTNKQYDITLINDFRVKIVEPNINRTTWTTVMNTISWSELPQSIDMLSTAKKPTKQPQQQVQA